MQNLILALLPIDVTLQDSSQSLGGNPGPDLSQYFLVCGILVFVMGLIAYGMRKLIAGNLKMRGSQRSLQIIDVLGLGGRRKLAVVRCYDRTFVLGLGEKEVSAIAELDSAIGSDTSTEIPRKSDQAAFAFALEKIREAMPAKPPANQAIPPQDVVAPSLAQKMNTRAAEQATAPATAPAAPVSKVTKKRVRRKVAKRTQPTSSQRHADAEAVASAALEMAAAKRAARAPLKEAVEVRATPQHKARTSEEPAILRMEGILG